jgi:ABC-type Fe3+ transport system permease subunit
MIAELLQNMKATVTITSRGVVTLPIELYSQAREREFDAAEAELAAVLGEKTSRPKLY